MTVNAWTATHTGLPCIYSDHPARIATTDGRVLSDGTGTGPVLLSDALAVPGELTAYTVGSETVRVTRRDDGHMLTSLSGRQRVQVAWVGDDEDEIDPRVAFMDVASRRSPVTRHSLRASSPRGTLNVRTVSAGTRELRGLVEVRGPIVAVHSPRACEIPDCDIEPVRVVVCSSVSSLRIGRVDSARRIWKLAYRELDAREQGRLGFGAAPIVTWGEWMAYQARTGDRADHSLLELASLIGGMPS